MYSCLLSSAYFAPVQWYSKLNRYGTSYVETCDNFVKQTYRNRCVIATTNGTQSLTVPVERGEAALRMAAGEAAGDGFRQDGKLLMRDVRISDHGNWRHLHWNALKSAYGESPFFEYYADDIRPFFERRWTFLHDFNMEICNVVCGLLDIQPDVRATEQYLSADEAAQTGMADFRDAIRPKHPLPDSDFSPRSYYQVYGRKHGFIPNLSILDLLFNMGNESVLYL